MIDLAEAPTADAADVKASAFWRQVQRTIATAIEAALTPLRQPRTVTLLFVLNTGNTATALATTDFLEAPVDFPFVITGHTILSQTSGAIVLSVARAMYIQYPTFVSICAGSPPTLAVNKATDDNLTGWTTQIDGTDVLRIGVTSNAGALSQVSLGLRCRILGPPSRR